MLEEDQQNEATTTQNEEPLEKNVRTSTRTRTESTSRFGYAIFQNQEIDAYGDFIGEVIMMAGLELIDLDLAMNDSNWLAVMQEELEKIYKNKT